MLMSQPTACPPGKGSSSIPVEISLGLEAFVPVSQGAALLLRKHVGYMKGLRSCLCERSDSLPAWALLNIGALVERSVAFSIL